MGLESSRQILAQQATGGAANPVQAAARLADLTQDWMNGKLSSPGISVEVREVERRKPQGKLLVKYRVYIKGAPKGQIYKLLLWPIYAAKPLETMDGLTISSDGLVLSGGRKDDLLDLIFSPGQGEIFRVGLISADHSTQISFAVVPDPIITKDSGCSLEVVRLTPKFELALLRAKGYQPNEDLLFTSKSFDESKEKQVKADGEGAFVSALMPFVKDKQTGTTDVKLKCGSCAPELSFDWGK